MARKRNAPKRKRRPGDRIPPVGSPGQLAARRGAARPGVADVDGKEQVQHPGQGETTHDDHLWKWRSGQGRLQKSFKQRMIPGGIGLNCLPQRDSSKSNVGLSANSLDTPDTPLSKNTHNALLRRCSTHLSWLTRLVPCKGCCSAPHPRVGKPKATRIGSLSLHQNGTCCLLLGRRPLLLAT